MSQAQIGSLGCDGNSHAGSLRTLAPAAQPARPPRHEIAGAGQVAKPCQLYAEGEIRHATRRGVKPPSEASRQRTEPSIPGEPSFSSSLMLVIMASVVSMSAAIDAAF